MSFSSNVKAELCKEAMGRKSCAVAESYGVLLYCNTFTSAEIRIITESRDFAARLPKLFKRAFGGAETAVTDMRVNTNFNAKAPSGELEVKLENGVMEYSGKGSLYPVCDGKVVSVVEEDGKYTVTVKHSDVFKSVISGVDFVYADKGDEVFKYVPVCFVNDGTAKVYMYNQDALITDYVIEGGSIVWAN